MTFTTFNGWNWVRGHFLSMDKGTTRGMIGAQSFQRSASALAADARSPSSRPAGLNVDEVRKPATSRQKSPAKTNG